MKKRRFHAVLVTALCGILALGYVLPMVQATAFAEELPTSSEGTPPETISIDSAVISVTQPVLSSTGIGLEPEITVSMGGMILQKDVDYTVSYASNVHPGIGRIYVTGIHTYTGTKSAEFVIQPWRIQPTLTLKKTTDGISLSWNSIEGATGYRIYRQIDKKAEELLATQTGTSYIDSSEITTTGEYHYTVIPYWEANGEQYLGDRSAQVSVYQVKVPSLRTLRTGKTKMIRIVYGKCSNVDGYVLQYGTDPTFKKNTKTIHYTGDTAIAQTVSHMGLGETHYVRACAYKIVNGTKVSGAWSATEQLEVTCKICIDPGHIRGESKTGEYDNIIGSFSEATFSLTLSNYLKQELEKKGFEVVMTRTTAENPTLSLKDRGRMAKGCDYILSIHSNATDSYYAIHRVEAYCSVDGTADALAKKIATAAQKVMGGSKPEYYHIYSDDHPGENYFGVLRHAKKVGVSGVIMEHSYYTTASVRSWLVKNSNLKRLAKEEAKAIMAYYHAT